MVTHVYICNACDGDISERTFECQYEDMQHARDADIPMCPRCGSPDHVARYFGHRLFARKRRPQSPIPDRFVPMNAGHVRGIISIGFCATEENRDEVERHIKELVEKTNVTLVPSESDKDVPEEVFGLKKGTVERTLFDLRQERMVRELEEGKSISGFFMPISGDCNN
jgi:hypothetical protein